MIAEQFGICAYTGTPLDDRLGPLQDAVPNLVFQPHVEHIKPRSVCRDELEDRGGIYGCELCEDMDHRNLVAALEVRRNPPLPAEIFGAAAHGNEELPVTPVQPDCESRFTFDDNGGIGGTDDDAIETIGLLRLDHVTMEGWRKGAIQAFFPIDEMPSRDEVQQLIESLDTPNNGRLPEFSFCIRGYAMLLLGES
ncbi:MAG: hypothetical protein GY854_15765 [Deltaproteobacteria bacterium]|nr:hypothetical protein [Deltaproteobacteria bacterium]